MNEEKNYPRFHVAYLDTNEEFKVQSFHTLEEAQNLVKNTPMNDAQIFEGRLVKTKHLRR